MFECCFFCSKKEFWVCYLIYISYSAYIYLSFQIFSFPFLMFLFLQTVLTQQITWEWDVRASGCSLSYTLIHQGSSGGSGPSFPLHERPSWSCQIHLPHSGQLTWMGQVYMSSSASMPVTPSKLKELDSHLLFKRTF